MVHTTFEVTSDNFQEQVLEFRPTCAGRIWRGLVPALQDARTHHSRAGDEIRRTSCTSASSTLMLILNMFSVTASWGCPR